MREGSLKSARWASHLPGIATTLLKEETILKICIFTNLACILWLLNLYNITHKYSKEGNQTGLAGTLCYFPTFPQSLPPFQLHLSWGKQPTIKSRLHTDMLTTVGAYTQYLAVQKQFTLSSHDKLVILLYPSLYKYSSRSPVQDWLIHKASVTHEMDWGKKKDTVALKSIQNKCIT